jgi:hypothetical protein
MPLPCRNEGSASAAPLTSPLIPGHGERFARNHSEVKSDRPGNPRMSPIQDEGSAGRPHICAAHGVSNKFGPRVPEVRVTRLEEESWPIQTWPAGNPNHWNRVAG